MSKEVSRIEIHYSDGTFVRIDQWQIEQLYKLQDTVVLLEKAKQVFDNLSMIFGKKEL